VFPNYRFLLVFGVTANRLPETETASMVSNLLAVWLLVCISRALALNFTIAGGQIFTPGFAILDSPQPGTPLGGGKFM
jgi:hypothetical protein